MIVGALGLLSVKCLTLEQVHDLRVVELNPVLGFAWAWSLLKVPSLPPPPK